ncbi:MAG: class I SAM-dependent methyltransferase [Ruminococcus sp.]|nr:class I SAM-dependent methyltransferase [Ruminococcus sp.]
MTDYPGLVIVKGEGVADDAALALSKHLGAPLSDSPGEGLTLMLEQDGLSLVGYGLRFQGDFTQMLRRISGGRLSHEMLVRIVKTRSERPIAFDAAAGMGEDALLLAAAGYTVYLFEQDAVIAALLRDAIHRAKRRSDLKEIVGRMILTEGNSIELMQTVPEQPEIIYLDPMFPARRKSGLINKKLQLIQKLEQPCAQEQELLEAALALHPKKIVIKRPLNGVYLAGRKPSYTVKGKAIRYDVIVL